MYPEAKKYGMFCPKHGTSFVTQEQFDGPDYVCGIDDCQKICLSDSTLYSLWHLKGCAFCGKIKPDEPFVYDNGVDEQGLDNSRIFCHLACLKCYRRRCTIYSCLSTAQYKLFFHLGDEELLIPNVFCGVHAALAKDDLRLFLSLYQSVAKLTGKAVPPKEVCRVELRNY